MNLFCSALYWMIALVNFLYDDKEIGFTCIGIAVLYMVLDEVKKLRVDLKGGA